MEYEDMMLHPKNLILSSGHNPPPDKAQVKLMKVSIERHGLFSPPIVRRSEHWHVNENPLYDVLAGAHRVAACQELGMDAIPCRVVQGEVTTEQLQLVHTVENLHRKQMTAEQKAEYEAKYKALWGVLNPNAKAKGKNAKSAVRESATAQGVAASTVRRRLAKAAGKPTGKNRAIPPPAVPPPPKVSITPAEYTEPEPSDPILDDVAAALDLLFAYVAHVKPALTKVIDSLRKELL